MNIVDLTAPLYDGMPVYDGDPPVVITTVRTREQDGWELRALSFGSHTGTHVDVPVHMHASAATLDDVPLQRFCGPARVVHPDDADFPSGLGLLFEAPVNAVTARRLIAASPPFVGGPIDEEAERLLLGEGIITFTDLVNVDQLRGKAFTFYGLPLRIQHGDGSPVRAVAVLSVEP